MRSIESLSATVAVIAVFSAASLSSQAVGQERSRRYLAGARVGFSDGSGQEVTFRSPRDLVVDGSDLYVEDRSNHAVRRIELTSGRVTTAESRDPASGAESACLAADGRGSLYLCFNVGVPGVSRIDLATGLSAPLAGRASGEVDGWGSTAGMGLGTKSAVWANGSLFVLAGRAVRRIEVPSGRTTLVAGRLGPYSGSSYPDGPALFARFADPTSIGADAAGNLYIADGSNCVVRKLDRATGTVSTIAGLAGRCDAVEGIGSAARFMPLGAIAVDSAGNVAVCEPASHVIRRIAAGTNRVTTFVGTRGLAGNLDGDRPSARISGPAGLAFDSAGNLYVSDSDSAIRRVDPSGRVSTLAGPESRVIPVRQVLTPGDYIGTAGLAADERGLFALDARTHEVKKILLPSGEIAGIAGRRDIPGQADGTGTNATFRNESTLRTDGTYLYSQQEQKLRRIEPENGKVITLPFAVSETFTVDPEAVFHRTPNGVVRRTDLATGQARDLPLAPLELRALSADRGSGRLYATYVSVLGNRVVRLDRDTGEPTVIAGALAPGSADGFGTGARFASLGELCFDGDRSLYVLEPGANPPKIRRVDVLTTQVTTVTTAADAAGLERIACDGFGQVFVSDGRGVISDLPPILPDQAVAEPEEGSVGVSRAITAAPQTVSDATYRISRMPSRSTATLRGIPSGGVLLTPDVPDVFEVELTARSAEGAYRRTSVFLSATQLRCVAVTAAASPGTGGIVTVSAPPGCPAGRVPLGQAATLTAQRASGYAFGGWVETGGSDRFVLGSSLLESTTLTAMDDVALEARFAPAAQCVEFTFIQAQRVESVNCLGPAGSGLLVGTSFTVVPSPPSTGIFSYWRASGARLLRSGDEIASFEVLGAGVVTAVFNPPLLSPDSARRFYTVNPCRLVDSREAGPASLLGERRAYPLANACGVPATASAVSLNVTALQATSSGELRVFAAGTHASTPTLIPIRPGQTRAVGAFVRLSADSGRAVTVETLGGTGTTQFLLDVNGYWQ